MEWISIEKEYSTSVHDWTRIDFKGNSKNKNLDKEIELLDRLLSDRIWNPSDLIRMLKTIFSSMEKTTLQIDQRNGMFRTLLILKDWNLEEYRDQAQRREGRSITIDFHRENGMSMKVDSSEKTFPKEELSFAKFLMDEAYRLVEKIPSITQIVPTEKEKNYCAMYRAFYGENPDFSQEESRNQMNEMIALLTFCGLMEEPIPLSTSTEREIPTNSLLEKQFRNLAPLGEIEVETSLPDTQKEAIIELGTSIQKFREITHFEEEAFHQLILSILSSPTLSVEEIELDMEDLTGKAMPVVKAIQSVKSKVQS